jgi:predicted ATPase/DNA-binding SARP family transcriptional activator
MTGVQVGVLGELTVMRDGSPIEVTGGGRRALLGLLATSPGRPVTLDHMVDGLWGAAPPPSAVKVVQTHVSQLRRLLEPDRTGDWDVLITHPSGYELAVPPAAVDAARFEARIRDATELPAADAVEILRDALGLVRGPPYAGIDRPFARVEAARLERLRRSALSRCLAGELARGRHEEIQPELRALVAQHPLDESLAELLMVALYRNGQPAEALRVHAELRQHLADELGADPGPSVSRLHQQILRHDPGLDRNGVHVRAATASTGTGNLPTPRSSFVGRHREVAEVAALVRHHRLATLVGAGGAGKTRLALRVAAVAGDLFDGTWLVSLGTLDDATHLDGHCLTELGIIDQMDRAPGDTLRGWIGDRHLLLVLDNCEHLADAVASLVDRLLATCPKLHVLATSRQPLHCPGERQWRVPTLGLPGGADVAAVADSEAGSLFVERATEARPGFVLDATTASAVRQVCRRLDGIPLAIELAAVRMATMSAAELAAGLDDRFELLTSGNRTALPRHRTLLATTDWSYDLLTPQQQLLLCRLSTFVAGFDVDAALDVCGAPPLAPRQVPGMLADLVDHSLVEARQVDGRTRYRQLETVREYGQERLGADAADLVVRHGDWVARFAEAVGANAHLDTVSWYARLDREFLHLQAAFAAAVRRGDAETALRIAAGSGWALIIIGRFHRLREWLHRALELAREGTVDDRVMAQGLMMAGAVAGIDHRFDGTLDLLEEARQRFEAAGSPAGALWTGYWRAATLAEMGELEGALAQIAATAAEAADAGLSVVEAHVRAEQAELIVAGALARGNLGAGDLEDAMVALARVRALCEPHQMQELAARIGLSEVLLVALRGDPAGALVHARQQLDNWRELGRGNRLILGLVATAKVALLAGQPDAARPLVVEAVRLIGEFAWSGALRGAAEVVVVLAANDDPAAAATLLGAAEARRPTHRWRMPLDLSAVRSMLQDVLSPEAFTACHADGAAMSLDEVVHLCLATMAPRSE